MTLHNRRSFDLSKVLTQAGDWVRYVDRHPNSDTIITATVLCAGAVASAATRDTLWVVAATGYAIGWAAAWNAKGWNQRRRNRRIPPPTPETQP